MRCCLTLSYLLEMHSLILEQAACHCIGPPLHVQYFRKTLSVTLMTLCLRLHPVVGSVVYMWCPRGTALVALDTVNEQYFGHRCDLKLFVHS